MKIAFLITSTGWGGLEMNTIKLAKSLVKLNYEITLFTKDNATILENKEHAFQTTVLIKKNRKYFDFKTAKQIANVLKEKEISTIFIVDNKDLDVTAWSKALYFKNLKIVYQQHMQIGIPKKNLLQTFRFNKIDKWITPLNYLKEEIKIQTKFDSRKVVQIPIGVDIDTLFKNNPTKEDARLHFGFKETDFVVGIIGRISRKKGQLFVVEALKEELKNNPNLKLLIYGSATVNDEDCKKYEKELHAFVKREKLDKNITFHPHSANVSSFFKSINLFALASESETYGMVTLEALFHKTPVLATKSGGTSDLLNQGEFGELYTYQNQEDFLSKFHKIQANFETAKTKSNIGFEFAMKNYTLEVESSSIHQLLQDL
jgi:D-inositol-3-phosphate glycosyltransferase